MSARRKSSISRIINLSYLGSLVQVRRGGDPFRAAGAACGVSPSTLFRVERGLITPDLDTYVKICRWLGLRLSDFLMNH